MRPSRRAAYAKLAKLTDITAANGTVFEFYSPGYTGITMQALHLLASRVRHEETRIRARAMMARLALTTALHIHPATRCLAGPFSRAYAVELLGNRVFSAERIREWIRNGMAPAWIERVLDRTPPLPMQIDEAAVMDWDLAATTYLDEPFSMGLASREVSRQTATLIIQYPRPEPERPGIILSRYLINDTCANPIAADSQHAQHPLPYESGKFLGVQSGPRAICLYAPRTLAHPFSLAPCSMDEWHSAKAAVIWTRRDDVDGIWIDGAPVQSLPADVPGGAVVTIASGPIYTALRPLSRTDLGCGAPLRLTETQGMLAFEMHNYLGPPRSHGDAVEPMSRFYRGQPQCGFYVEVAARDAYPDGPAFAQAIAQGEVTDDCAPEVTSYMDDKKRPWSVAYARDGHTLGIEIDLMNWKLLRRWTEQGDLEYAMLECPVARQSLTGRVEVGAAVLECAPAPAWLYADAEGDLYIAGYHGEPGPLAITTPTGRVQIDNMGAGTVVIDQGAVTVEALGNPRIHGV